VAAVPESCVKIYCVERTIQLAGTGVVIHPRWVLTAWHVAARFFNGATARIVAGTQTVDGIVRLSHTLPPSDSWLGPDLALIELTADLNVTVMRWASTAEFDNACEGSFAGFGPPPGEPHVRTCTFDLARCVRAPGKYSYDPAINFVAVPAPGAFHFGDSGGPMLIPANGELKLAGVLSHGTTPRFSPRRLVAWVMRKWPRFYFAARLFFFRAATWARGAFTRADAHKAWAERLTGQIFS
jgi:hypothetical protein